jgi:hypothetical protein
MSLDSGREGLVLPSIQLKFPGNQQQGEAEPSSEPEAENTEQRLFTESTIATDATKGAESRELELLYSEKRTSNNQNGSLRIPPPILRAARSRSDSDSEDSEDNSRIIQANRAASKVLSAPKCKDDIWRKELLATRRGRVGIRTKLNNENYSGNFLGRTQLPQSVDSLLGEHSIPKPQKLGSALGSVADEYLKLDILDDNNDTSQYVAFLLDTIQGLQSRVDFLSKENDTTNIGAQINQELESTAASPRVQVLHRVFCGSSLHKHNAMIYEDEPRLATQTSGLLAGEEMVFGDIKVSEMSSYLRKRSEILAVVFKEHRCVSTSITEGFGVDVTFSDFHRGSQTISPGKERLKITSHALQEAVNEVAKCCPDFMAFTGSGHGEYSLEMDAPYYFLFHHRRKLRKMGKTRPEYHIPTKLLLEYLEIFEKEYLEAEDLFERGVVSEKHIRKLFRPGQIVVTKESNHDLALVLDRWPTRTYNQLRFSGWKWYYNGRTLERENWFEKMEVDFTDEKDIKELLVYPIEYLSSNATEKIRLRGKRFWETKFHQLVAYDGWDYHRDYCYVSSISKLQTEHTDNTNLCRIMRD